MRRFVWLTLSLIACRTEDKGSLPDTVLDDSAAVVDEDADGSPSGEDCDDSNAAVNPSAAEVCDGLDNNCDGVIDTDASDASTWYADSDGDGSGTEAYTQQACTQPEGYAAAAGDCDDSDASIHPGAEETDCNDPIDYNCDGSVGYADNDGDSRPACEDCDDADAESYPGAPELCDGQDDDCDGDVDEPEALDASTWTQDADGDGYGDDDYTTRACTQPSGYASEGGDCDDSLAAVNPGATEVCDELDNDCDSEVDEPSASDASSWYNDADEDGYGDPKRSQRACEQPSGTVSNSGDCDDTEAAAWTGASEVCDEVDNDCDGDVDEGVTTEWWLDSDKDGYGEEGTGVFACEAPTSRYVSQTGDCNDLNANYNPGEAEGCDGKDHNCDGSIDNDADGDGYSDISCGGDDCDDSDASTVPEVGGGCALGTDCLDILNQGLSVGDGSYTIDPDGYGTGDSPFDATCDMSTDGGGWTLILDKDYGKDSCPSGWTSWSAYSSCYRGSASGGSIASVTIDTLGITWQEVMGLASLYQYASADGFHGSGDVTTTTSIDGAYVDGLSLTYGASGSRGHIFTWGMGLTPGYYTQYDCPNVGGQAPPSFVGSNYLCSTANTSSSWSAKVYTPALFSTDDFQMDTGLRSARDMEARLMLDQGNSDEDVLVQSMELWIR